MQPDDDRLPRGQFPRRRFPHAGDPFYAKDAASIGGRLRQQEFAVPALGIGIITFNRRELLAGTIERVRAMTREPDTLLMVADDGSTDGTLEMLGEQCVPVVTGPRRGVAWNKNRALFTLGKMLGCDVVLLLEDDTWPDVPGWEQSWIAATRRWGHVSYAVHRLQHYFHAGSGSPDDPYVSGTFSAQCCGYLREALTYGGYFDSRFLGFGHEHVEHTVRLGRVGFGTRSYADAGVDPGEQPPTGYVMIGSGVSVQRAQSNANQQEIDRNLPLARELMKQRIYRAPWDDDVEMRQFRDEVTAALRAGEAAFRLHPKDAPSQQWAVLPQSPAIPQSSKMTLPPAINSPPAIAPSPELPQQRRASLLKFVGTA